MLTIPRTYMFVFLLFYFYFEDPDPDVIKKKLCSTHLSIKFQLLIKTKLGRTAIQREGTLSWPKCCIRSVMYHNVNPETIVVLLIMPHIEPSNEYKKNSYLLSFSTGAIPSIFNPFLPCVLFMVHRQIVQAKIRHRLL